MRSMRQADQRKLSLSARCEDSCENHCGRRSGAECDVQTAVKFVGGCEVLALLYWRDAR